MTFRQNLDRIRIRQVLNRPICPTWWMTAGTHVLAGLVLWPMLLVMCIIATVHMTPKPGVVQLWVVLIATGFLSLLVTTRALIQLVRGIGSNEALDADNYSEPTQSWFARLDLPIQLSRWSFGVLIVLLGLLLWIDLLIGFGFLPLTIDKEPNPLVSWAVFVGTGLASLGWMIRAFRKWSLRRLWERHNWPPDCDGQNRSPVDGGNHHGGPR